MQPDVYVKIGAINKVTWTQRETRIPAVAVVEGFETLPENPRC